MTPRGAFFICPNEDKRHFVNTPNLWQVTDQMERAGSGIQSAIPTPTVDTVYSAAAGMVNGLAAQNAGSGGSYTVNLVLENGTKIAAWLLPDLRDAARNNPEVAPA